DGRAEALVERGIDQRRDHEDHPARGRVDRLPADRAAAVVTGDAVDRPEPVADERDHRAEQPPVQAADDRHEAGRLAACGPEAADTGVDGTDLHPYDTTNDERELRTFTMS